MRFYAAQVRNPANGVAVKHRYPWGEDDPNGSRANLDAFVPVDMDDCPVRRQVDDAVELANAPTVAVGDPEHRMIDM